MGRARKRACVVCVMTEEQRKRRRELRQFRLAFYILILLDLLNLSIWLELLKLLIWG